MSRHGSTDLGQENQAFELELKDAPMDTLELQPEPAGIEAEVVDDNNKEDLKAAKEAAKIVSEIETAASALLNGVPEKSVEDDNNDEDQSSSDDDKEKMNSKDETNLSGKPSHSAGVIGSDTPAAGFSGGFENKGYVPDLDDKLEDQPPPYSSSPIVSNDVTKPEFGNELDNPQFSRKPSDLEASAEPTRGQWTNQMEFLLSCIAMSVGLGNIWRFPFTAKENGGGAFLIPYLIVLLFVGRPIYFLELCLGQFCSLSQVKVWRINPLFRGVGYGSMIATVLVMSYYCSIMALTVFYFVASFAETLPWDKCDETWGIDCSTNQTSRFAEWYYLREVLKEKSQIDDGIGYPEWRMTLCLLFSWAVIWGSLIKGVKSSGKVAYFTALFPYVVLLILLVRGVTLEGAWTGIKYFIEPQWSELAKPKVWYAAVSQCFYSLNTGFGSVIMFSSYNPFSHNIYRDAIILSFMDTFTSLLAGFTIFSVLGNLNHLTKIPIEELEGGNGLAFIYYPSAIASFDWAPQLFSVLFFIMLFTLGIGSATADAGAIITIFVDQFPKVKRWHITSILCSFAFLVGLVYVTPGGQFVLNLVDFYGASFVIFITSVLEVIGVAWFYGINNFIDDIHFMLKIKIGWYWKICWGIVIPVGLTAILVYTFAVDYVPLKYNGKDYPPIANVLGWIMAGTALAAIPVFAIIAIKKSPKTTFIEKLKDAGRPTDKWGPRDPKIRAEWIEYKKRV